MPSLHISPPTAEQKEQMDQLYIQNLNLAKRINQQTKENTFYQIQINNFDKLTNSINKDLYQLGINFQKNTKDFRIKPLANANQHISSQNNIGLEIQSGSKLTPLFTVSNKIKLKNLQMKIGNSIRDAEKLMKKNLQGSIGPLESVAQETEKDLSLIYIKNVQLTLENKLLKTINSSRRSVDHPCSHNQLLNITRIIDDLYEDTVEKGSQSDIFMEDGFLQQFQFCLDLGKHQNLQQYPKPSKKNYTEKLGQQQIKNHKQLKQHEYSELQTILNDQSKTAEYLKKQKQEKQKILFSITKTNMGLSESLNKLKKNIVPSDSYISLSNKQKLALEMQHLERQEKKLINMITHENAELQEQYGLNKESKQKIADRKYQQIKEVKVLEEEVAKCRDQLKQIKAKCRNKDNIGGNFNA